MDFFVSFLSFSFEDIENLTLVRVELSREVHRG